MHKNDKFNAIYTKNIPCKTYLHRLNISYVTLMLVNYFQDAKYKYEYRIKEI